VQKLDKYLEEGGRLVFFADAQDDAGLANLLRKYGLELDNGLVLRAARPVCQQAGGLARKRQTFSRSNALSQAGRRPCTPGPN